MLHGKKEAEEAFQTAKDTFQNKIIGSKLPFVHIDKKFLDSGLTIIDLVLFAKISDSKSEIRRVIKNRGIRLNDVIIEPAIEKQKYNSDIADKNNNIKISHGKKTHVILKII